MSYKFDEKVATPLCEIMGKYQSDKGHKNIQKSWHNYTTLYYSLFKDMQAQPLRIFELGLGTNNPNIPSNMGVNGKPGASLYGWREFFKNSKIYGADIDSKILFKAERIQTFYCDQTHAHTVVNMWKLPDLTGMFDIIIDDGLHTFSANKCFFENSIHKLAPNGYYIIEDVLVNDIHHFEAVFQHWKTTYPTLSFTLIRIPSTVNANDNNVIVIKKA